MISPSKQAKPTVPRSETRKIGMNQSLIYSKNMETRGKNSMHQVLNFKMGSIFIEANDDGIILSDHTK
jgi:hypothetical protein